jgi:hypothetical protein
MKDSPFNTMHSLLDFVSHRFTPFSEKFVTIHHPQIFLSYPAHPAYHVTFHHVYRTRESNMIGMMDKVGIG